MRASLKSEFLKRTKLVPQSRIPRMLSLPLIKPTPSSTPSLFVTVRFVLSLLLLTLLLRLPGKPSQLIVDHWLYLPLEVPVIVLILLILQGKAFAAARFLLISFLSLLLLLRVGDLISRTAFGRAFNPIAEWHLVTHGWSLTAKTLGKTEALALVAGSMTLLILIAVFLYYGLGYLAHLSKQSRRRALVTSALVTIIGIGVMGMEVYQKKNYRVGMVTFDELSSRIEYAHKKIKDQTEFTELLATDHVAESAPRFDALQGRDVIILFIESYGRTFIDSEQFADKADARLKSVESEILDAGLSVKSAWIDSPIRGGRSWLAHATLSSGLPLTDHARFDRLITSDRKSLPVLFSEAGWETSVLLPVVKGIKWVEGEWYNVDRFYDRDALEYQGEDFGYVTMPDQYTLTAFENKVRTTAVRPLMAHIGLLDSHAPWGPLPIHQPWDNVNDGSIFDGTQRHGERYSWAKPAPVRIAYGKSLDQTLKLVGEYLARYADDGFFIVVGDHQPASVIDGWAPSSEVPMHIISANSDLLQRLPALNFNDGMRPKENAVALPMHSVRDMLSTVYEDPLISDEITLR